MAILRNREKLAAVSRETPENTRTSQSQNTLDPELAQEYISLVFEKMEGRITKNISKEFSRTESRILGALSKLDEFLLSPQLRTCSVVVPGTTRNSNSGKRELNGERTPNDPCPEARISSHHSGNLNNSDEEEYPHKCKMKYFKYSIFYNELLSEYLLAPQRFAPGLDLSSVVIRVQYGLLYMYNKCKYV